MLKRYAVGLAMTVLLFAGCSGVPSELKELGDRIGCDEVEVTEEVSMSGRGTAGFCRNLPNGQPGILLVFNSQADRDDFFRFTWEVSKFAGAFVLVGPDWAVAADAVGVDEASELMDEVGGVPLTELDL